MTDEEYLETLSLAECVVLPYTRGTNSGIPSTAFTMGTDVICSDIPVLKNNSLISRDFLFDCGSDTSLQEVMENIYSRNRTNRSNMKREEQVSEYRRIFNKELLAIYSL